jgi:hypothetical protein
VGGEGRTGASLAVEAEAVPITDCNRFSGVCGGLADCAGGGDGLTGVSGVLPTGTRGSMWILKSVRASEGGNALDARPRALACFIDAPCNDGLRCFADSRSGGMKSCVSGSS